MDERALRLAARLAERRISLSYQEDLNSQYDSQQWLMKRFESDASELHIERKDEVVPPAPFKSPNKVEVIEIGDDEDDPTEERGDGFKEPSKDDARSRTDRPLMKKVPTLKMSDTDYPAIRDKGPPASPRSGRSVEPLKDRTNIKTRAIGSDPAEDGPPAKRIRTALDEPAEPPAPAPQSGGLTDPDGFRAYKHGLRFLQFIKQTKRVSEHQHASLVVLVMELTHDICQLPVEYAPESE